MYSFCFQKEKIMRLEQVILFWEIFRFCDLVYLEVIRNDMDQHLITEDITLDRRVWRLHIRVEG